MGGSPCDLALAKYCPGEFQQGAACWACAEGASKPATKARPPLSPPAPSSVRRAHES